MILAILLAFQIVSTTSNIYSLLSVHFIYEDIKMDLMQDETSDPTASNDLSIHTTA